MARSLSRLFAFVGLLLALVWSGIATACPQARPTQADGSSFDLVVAMREKARPFTFFDDGGAQAGFAVALWEDVVETVRVPDGAGGTRVPTVQIVRCDTIDAQELALMSGRIDVVISPLTITSTRMQRYDFSQQYISSGLALAVPARSDINFSTAKTILKETVFSGTVAAAVLGFLSLNLVVALLIRWILFSPEERHAGGQLGACVRAGLEALMRTIGLRGIADGYSSAPAKVFEIFLAVVGTALSATILGILTSAFVGSVGTQDEIPARALPPLNIATLNCSTAQNLLQRQYLTYFESLPLDDGRRSPVAHRVIDLGCTPTPDDGPLPKYDQIEDFTGGVTLTRSWAEAMGLLAEGKVDAVLGDWVALTYLSRRDYAGKIDVLDNVYRNEPYGWGISRASVSEDVRRQIDSALIDQMRDSAWRGKLERLLGQGSVSPN